MIKTLIDKYTPDNVTVNKNIKKIEYNILGANVGVSNSTKKIIQVTYVNDTVFLKFNNFSLNFKL